MLHYFKQLNYTVKKNPERHINSIKFIHYKKESRTNKYHIIPLKTRNFKRIKLQE